LYHIGKCRSGIQTNWSDLRHLFKLPVRKGRGSAIHGELRFLQRGGILGEFRYKAADFRYEKRKDRFTRPSADCQLA
jgi:hypothetical protein